MKPAKNSGTFFLMKIQNSGLSSWAKGSLFPWKVTFWTSLLQIAFRCSTPVVDARVRLLFSWSSLAPFCFWFDAHCSLLNAQYWPYTAHLRFLLLADGSTLLMIFFSRINACYSQLASHYSLLFRCCSKSKQLLFFGLLLRALFSRVWAQKLSTPEKKKK